MRVLLRPVIVLLVLLSFLPGLARVAAQGFHIDDIVTTNSTVTVYENPTALSKIIAVHASGLELKIINGSPATAEGETWWQVETLNATSSGWAPEDRLDMSVAANRQDSTGSLADECWDAADAGQTETGAPQWAVAPHMVIDPAMNYLALLETGEGEIFIQLFAAEAPEAVNNFVCLASAGFYDGTAFHRVVSDAFIQGGDATGTGDGGPGYTFAAESEKPGYPEGAVALANTGPGTNGSQFFVTATDLTGQLPDDFPVFGQVVDGIYLVQGISRAQVYVNGRGELSEPATPILIDRVTISVFGPQIGPLLEAVIPTGTETQEEPAIVATPASTANGSDAGITLVAKDILFEPNELSLPAGQLVTLEIVNKGAAPHNFSINDLAVSVDLASGETKQITLISAAGQYDFYCNVPGHKEAGMVGTVTFGAGTAASTSDASATTEGCTGLEEYQEAYDAALFTAIFADPDVMEMLLALDEDVDFTEMTPEQWTAFALFFENVAVQLSLVTPPVFAAAWHENQVASMELFSQIFSTSASSGVFVAALSYGDDIERLASEAAIALDDAAATCPAFAAWALEEGIDVGSEI